MRILKLAGLALTLALILGHFKNHAGANLLGSSEPGLGFDPHAGSQHHEHLGQARRRRSAVGRQ